MTWFLTAVRHEVNNLESSVVVQELEFAINRALYVFFLWSLGNQYIVGCIQFWHFPEAENKTIQKTHVLECSFSFFLSFVCLFIVVFSLFLYLVSLFVCLFLSLHSHARKWTQDAAVEKQALSLLFYPDPSFLSFFFLFSFFKAELSRCQS